MLTTKRKPASVGEILTEEFLVPMDLTQGVLAQAMGVPRKHVNELCNDRRSVTAPTDLWETMNSPQERERIARARSLKAAA